MIDLSKWNKYTKEQKRRKIPWIIFVAIVWCVIIAFGIVAIITK